MSRGLDKGQVGYIDGAVVANLESVKPEIKSTVFLSGLEGHMEGHFQTSPFSPC